MVDLTRVVTRVVILARSPGQVDEVELRAKFVRQAQCHPFRAVVAKGKKGAACGRPIVAARRLGLRQNSHRWPRARVQQQRQQGVEAVRPFDQHRGRTQLVQHRLQRQGAGRAVVAHRREMDAVQLHARQAGRDLRRKRLRIVGHAHRLRAASPKLFQALSRRPRSRTTVSK